MIPIRGRLKRPRQLVAAVSIHSFQSEAISRGARMLRTAFGPAIARYLEDPAIIEVMLNPDGRLWIDRLSGGLAETGERLSARGTWSGHAGGGRCSGYWTAQRNN